MKLPIAIEISEKYLKINAAHLAGTRMKVSNCVVERISALSGEQITALLVSIFTKFKIKPRSLTLSVSRNAVTVRNLHLPSQNKQEITQMIDLNVARMVPYKREEILFNYRLLGIDEMGYSKVILAIVKRDLIRRQIKIVEDAGYPVDQISLSTYGVADWCYDSCRSDMSQNEIYLLLDIDSSFSDFIIFSYNNLLFSRSINVGAESISSDKENGTIKILGEVKQSLIMFYNEELNKKPAAVFISGADINPEIARVFESELGFPVRMLAQSCPKECLKDMAPGLGKEVSLTAVAEFSCRESDKHINFVLPEMQIRKSLREKTRDIIIIGSLCIYVFTVVCISFLGKIQNQLHYLSKVKSRCSAIEAEFGDKLDYLSKIQSVKKFLGDRDTAMFVVANLQKNLPQEISLNSISIDEEGKVVLRGNAVQLADVYKFSGVLEKVEHFKDIQEKSTRKKRVKDKDLTEFELVFKVGI